MNKFTRLTVVAGFALVAGTVFASPVAQNLRTIAGTEDRSDVAMRAVIKTIYEPSTRSTTAPVLNSSLNAAVAPVTPADGRDPEQPPLTGPATLLAALALICGIAIKRLSA